MIALFGSIAARAQSSSSVRELVMRWAEEAAEGLRWQGRPELRQTLPFLDDLSNSCVKAGEGTILREVLPEASQKEFWICASSSSWLDPSQTDTALRGEFETCEICEEISAFYGQPIFVCTRKSMSMMPKPVKSLR